MDVEYAMNNIATRSEKKFKSKTKKSEKSDEASMGTQQSQNVSDVDATERVQGLQASEKVQVVEMKKAKKSKEGGSHITLGSEQGELTVGFGEDRSGEYPMYNVEKEMDKSSQYAKEEIEENERKNGEGIFKMKNTKERKKKHKVKRKLQNVDFEGEEGDIQNSRERKKRKMDKKKSRDDSSFLQQKTNVEGNIGLTEHDGNDGKELKRKKKKDKTKYNNENGLMHTNDNGFEGEENGSDDSSPNKSNKKVRFSGQDEVFPIPGNSNTKKENVGVDGLIRGTRFSAEEDETVKAAVSHYIKKNNLGDDGLEMVLNSREYPNLKGCWKEIGSAIPYRPYVSVYCRAQILFRRAKTRKWTQGEYDQLRSYQKEHGNKWAEIAKELGKHRRHVSNAWLRIKLNPKYGNWSQEEYQKLFNLVNLDLQAKVSEEKISKHGMLRDNICWTSISDVLSTRSVSMCCLKWYNKLTSRMVADGVWADTDDYRLIDALYELDATCVDDVDWDDLLENRMGDLCRRRWNQMVLHIGHHGKKSFSEQVEVLAQRYCPILMEARETWDNKPRVG